MQNCRESEACQDSEGSQGTHKIQLSTLSVGGCHWLTKSCVSLNPVLHFHLHCAAIISIAEAVEELRQITAERRDRELGAIRADIAHCVACREELARFVSDFDRGLAARWEGHNFLSLPEFGNSSQ